MATTSSLLLHPVDVNGKEIDASFAVDRHADGYSLYFASRGGTVGTSASRNSEYHVGLTLLLSRLKGLEAVLTDLLIDSAAARRHPLDERRLRLPEANSLPIKLRNIEDLDRFRRTVSEAQRNVLTAPGRNLKHGNRVRSIRILFNLPNGPELLEQVTSHLVGRELVSATADPAVLKDRSQRLRVGGIRQQPMGSRTPGVVEMPQARRYQRFPSVVAYVLARADGRCELCGSMTFTTDDGDVYLEVHHVVQLSNGGPDTTDNAVALCPNCHRELHYGVRRKELVQALYAMVPQLSPPQ